MVIAAMLRDAGLVTVVPDSELREPTGVVREAVSGRAGTKAIVARLWTRQRQLVGTVQLMGSAVGLT